MARRSTTQRGYGAAHKRKRAEWQPIVDAGDAYCHAKRCLKGSRWIKPGSEWHLGHTPDRTAWTGPEHPGCNTSEGATRGNRARGKPAATVRRRWKL